MRPWPRMVRTIVAGAIAAALWATPALAGEFALRGLPSVLWVEQARASLPKDIVAGVDAQLLARLDKALRGAFPDAMGIGDSRAGGTEMQRSLQDLLHVGATVSRLQVVTTRYGTEKTAWTLYLTGTVFVVNLGTGEVVAARSLTAVVPVEQLGAAPEQPDSATLADMLGRSTDALASQLVAQLKAGMKPGIVQAEVVGRVGSDFVLSRGRKDGAYVGETFRTADGATVRVAAVSDGVSRARSTGKAELARGAIVQRLGTVLEGGDAPRLLVQSSAQEGVLAAGVTGANLSSWAGDALAGKGYVVLPSGVNLIAAQMAESSAVDVAYEALVGAQAIPDILVVPTVRSVRITRTFDEASRATTLDYEAVVQATFIDVRSGLVLYGAEGSQKRQDYVKEGGRQVAVEDRVPALVKDATLVLADTVAARFNPRARVAPLHTGGPAEIEWKLDVGGFGRGTLVEVLDRGPEFKASNGQSLDTLDTLIGTARVVRTDAKLEVATVIASVKPVTGAMRVRAVAGSVGSDDRTVELGEVTVDGTLPKGVNLDTAVRGSLYLSDKLRAAVTGPELEAVAGFRRVLEQSGAFEAGATIAEGRSATHRLDVRVSAEAPPATETPAGKRLILERKVKVTLVGTLVDLATGKPVKLVTSKGEEKTSGTCTMDGVWTATVRPGEYAPGFGAEDTGDLVQQVVGTAMLDLARRLRGMADRGAGRPTE